MKNVAQVYEALARAYGYQGWWPLVSMAGQPGYDSEGYLTEADYRRPLSPEERTEIVAGALLTQNTAWNNARQAVAALVEHGLTNPERLRRLEPAELAPMILRSGAYNQKARKVAEAARFLTDALANGAAPSRENLLAVWGIGEESADSILLYAFRRPHFVVDAYARRLLSRLGIAEATQSYPWLQASFERALPRDVELFGEYHALIVRHAKERCRKEPLCAKCPLRSGCSFAAVHSPES